MICPKCGKKGILVRKWSKKRKYFYWYVNHREKIKSGKYKYKSCYIGSKLQI